MNLPNVDFETNYSSENTPKMLEMEDEDQIDCMNEQVGGIHFL